MTVTFGFYNSLNGDRKYNARDMNAIFDGIINDGVFMSVGTQLMVEAYSGMRVNVGIGRAWFNSTWTYNDAVLPLTLDRSELSLNRIDAVVLEIDANDSVRKNSIKIIKGTPSTNPAWPTMVRTEYRNHYPLAYIYVGKGVVGITHSDITNMVGTDSTPFAKPILETATPSGIIAMWSGLVNEIPEGWVLCDGRYGTPNLTGRFIMAATTDATINKTGGQNEVTLTTNQMPAHTHTGSTGTGGTHTHSLLSVYDGSKYPGIADQQGNTGRSSTFVTSSGSHTHSMSLNNTGGGQAHENRPAYYTLAFIMKV